MKVLTTNALALRNLAIGDSAYMGGATIQNMDTTGGTKNVAAATIAAEINQQSGIISLRAARPIELWDKPKATLITAEGRNAADSADAAVQTYAFNLDAYNVSVLDSDGTTASLPVVYNDGFNGKNLQRHIMCDNNARGIPFRQLQITATNSAGNQSLQILQQMNLVMQTYTLLQGKEQPYPVDIASAIRNTQFQSGTLTIDIDGWVNSQTQWNWYTPSGATITINVIWA